MTLEFQSITTAFAKIMGKAAEISNVVVFLDRDGVINEERGYVHRLEDFVFLPGAIAGMRLLCQAGYRLVVVTNQAGIAKGYYDEEAFLALTQHMRSILKEHGVAICDIYYCPHHPNAEIEAYRSSCSCRKPQAGMLRRAADDHLIDLSRSVLIGDKRTDIDAARSAKLKCALLVRSGHQVSPEDVDAADSCFDDLLSAAQWLCKNFSP